MESDMGRDEIAAGEELAGPVERLADRGGLSMLRLHGPGGASVDVCAQGAHVLSWRDASGHERLFLSPRAKFAPGAAIRGGVPVVFPQFSGRGVLPKHGLVRGLPWRFEGATSDVTSARIVFVLVDDESTRAVWPHAFEARLEAVLGARSLAIGLHIRNTGGTAFAFTAALHSYLAVEDLADAQVHGLEGRPYEDAAGGGGWRVQGREALRFDGELDRVYPEVREPLVLETPGDRLRVEAEGFPDVVVWNPGAALAASLPDLGADQASRFACIEAGAILKPVVLAAGGTWQGWQRLRTD